MIGSFVGAVVDPDRIYGPRLGDVRDQAASDGVPRTYGYGRFPTTGNIIWRDIVKEVEEEQGKGGPEQVTYTYTRSYAIGVCRGPISGFLIIKRNGKIVFDARTDAELTAIGYSSNDISETRAAQAKFMEVATLYYGDQNAPDPTMVAVKGVGNVPNYTDTAFIVCTDDDVKDISGAVPQYEFVVADCGDRHEEEGTDYLLVTGANKPFQDPVFAQALATDDLEFFGIASSTGANLTAMTAAFNDGIWGAVRNTGARSATTDLNDWTTGTVDDEQTPSFGKLVGNAHGWLTVIPNKDDGPTAYISPKGPPLEFTRTALTATFTNGFSANSAIQAVPTIFEAGGDLFMGGVRAFFRASNPAGPWTTIWDQYKEAAAGRNPNQASIIGWYDIAQFGGYWYAVIEWDFRDSLKRYQVIRSHNGLENWNTFDVLVDRAAADSLKPGQFCQGGGELVCYTTDGQLWTSRNGWSAAISTGITGPGLGLPGVLTAGGKRIVFANSKFYLIDATDKCVVYDPETGLVSAPITVPIQNIVSIAAGNPQSSGLVPIPDAPGYFINPETGEITGPAGTTINPCTPTLGSIVAEQCISRNVTEIDVSELTDPVTGFRIASVSSPQKNIAALMPAFMFDGSEFDGTLHFPKRGRNATFSLTMDDLVEREGDPIQCERTQEPELLRKLTVGYIDPATTYTPTTQQWERRAGTVRAEGESTMELPIVAEKDWAAQVAEKAGKVAWAEADTMKFWLSRQWANLVPAAVGTITDGKGVTHRIRIMRIEDDGGIRMIHAVRDRQDAYTSTATGAQKPLPLFPGSNIRGPTLAAVMNMPAGRDQDDRPGLTWAAAGMTDGWAGARLQVLRAGDWETLGDITTASSVGTLVDELPGHSGDLDEVNVMRIRMDDTLPSVTFTQLLNERNPVAIVRPDHTVEVVQFQNAIQDSDGVWECTTLIRGNLNTDRSGHDPGATVTLLDSGVRFVELRPDDVGKTLTFRVVSLGTDPDAAPTFDISFPYIWSSTEWPVAYLDVEKDGDDYTLTWIERRRLGTDADPIRSGNWDGYSVIYSYAGNSNEVTVTDPTHTFTLPGASDIDFTVAQLNRLTGRGPETTVNHE